MTPEKIIFVDDEPNILEGYKRALRKNFRIDVATSGADALILIKEHCHYAVIVSDMQMPGMDGAEFLARAKSLCPQSVRVMLTGNADQQTAIDAVNEGNIFRFLNKPCAPEVIAKTLRAAIEQYRLVRAEKDLIEKTLSASIQTLTDILSLINPTAFGRSMRVRHQVRQLTALLETENAWQADLAAMLSQIGCITIPEEILQKVYNGGELTPDELQMLQEHPQVAHNLLAHIPRLEPIAEAIAYQEKRFDGSGNPHDSLAGRDIPIAARILKVALDFDKLLEAKIPHLDALKEIERREDWYDPEIVAALKTTVCSETLYETERVNINNLKAGMKLAQDVVTDNGMLLVSSGHEITDSLGVRIRNFHKIGIIGETVHICVPVSVQPES